MIVLSKSKSLEEHFMDVESKQERNSIISLAYTEDGYSQIEIANFLGLSKSAISMIIKSDKSGDSHLERGSYRLSLDSINDSIQSSRRSHSLLG